MKLNRKSASHIRNLLDEFTPPIIGDSQWFMYLPMKLLFKDQARTFMTLKEHALDISPTEFQKVYEQIAPVAIQRATDVNDECIAEILKSIKGKTVLEAGCGNGFLAQKLSEHYKVTATDIIIDKGLKKKYSAITFKQANIEKLPFKDKSFDTVVTTHTLEHVQNIFQSISELRRVTKKRLIIVVPMHRPYKYTFDLHLHFFPYPTSLVAIMGNKKNSSCREIHGDLFYTEDKKV